MMLALLIIGIFFGICFLFMIYEIYNAEEINPNVDF